jgi:hypothetical protein
MRSPRPSHKLWQVWRADGTTRRTRPPITGQLIAYAHSVYRVTSIAEVPRDEWSDLQWENVHRYGSDKTPIRLLVSPESPNAKERGDIALLAYGDLVYGEGEGSVFDVYNDDHWPACGRCGEPSPCSEKVQEKAAAAEAKIRERFTRAGVCPACETPITPKQRTITFEENIYAPGEPPPTFHARVSCARFAVDYEKKLAEVDPQHKITLSCDGGITVHRDGTYECTRNEQCPGPAAHHSYLQACRCVPCHEHDDHPGCVLRPGAKRVPTREVPTTSSPRDQWRHRGGAA